MSTIMLVDDSATILLSISNILTKAGYAVEKASIEFIKEVRTLPNYKFMPILFLTTESQQSKRLEAKAAGASGWLVKPATADELLGTIKLVIR
jgi:two-component system chemotaxis response regulator CheY